MTTVKRPIDRVLDRLENARHSGSGWTALCPAHGDTQSSLSVREGDDGRVLLKCFAGCTFQEIAGALKLESRDFFPPRERAEQRQPKGKKDFRAPNASIQALSQAKHIPQDFLRELGVFDLDDGGVGIPYRDAEGGLIAIKRRTRLKAKEGSFWPKNQSLAAYGLDRLGDARKAGRLIIVEGESDCWTLWQRGFPALGLPGASSVRSTLTAEALDGVSIIYAIQETDRAGQGFVRDLYKRLRELDWKGEAYAVSLPAKDINELHILNPDGFLDALRDACEGAPLLGAIFGDGGDGLGADVGGNPENGGYHNTDLGNARRLVDQHGENIRYCNLWDKWLVWDGKRWATDSGATVYQMAFQTVMNIYREAAEATDEHRREKLVKWAKESESRRHIEAMVKLAERMPGVPIEPEQLDSNHWLLNVRNGTVDLKTGQLRPFRREDLLTKIAPVTYDPDAKCPTWLNFLFRIMDGNGDLIRFLKRALGYSLTGDTREQKLFLLYGTGQNGKTTMMEAVRDVVGAYARQSEFKTFHQKDSDAVRNDLARLAGVRFVSAVESGSGARLDEELIKQVTGADTITARFLYREFFDFRPAFKLWLAANHKPVIRGGDFGIWRRICLVPFTVRIPDNEKDPGLPDRLRGELSGILNWMIEGCLEWQREGLGQAEAVQAATADYKDEMDVLAGWIEDCCVVMAHATATASDLYASYEQWCKDNGERAMSASSLGRRLVERGFWKQKGAKGKRIWVGIGLLGGAGGAGGSDSGEKALNRLNRGTFLEFAPPAPPAPPAGPAATMPMFSGDVSTTVESNGHGDPRMDEWEEL